ncbi:MAG TPA: hemolysin family protein [Acidimicrobiia bacterium]|nr:hemolysin family protein [Acidimicrobiia bacterium]
MSGIWYQLILVGVLVVLNGVFAGAELALVSLREGQLRRLEERGGSGAVLADLARDPNRFLATIQIVITLAGFFASASAAVTIARPLADALSFLGGAADGVAVVAVTLVIAYFTLVFGELAPKRLAMQRAEGWGLLVARPLSFLATLTRPVVWLLSRSADLVVRLLGGDPERRTEAVTHEEARDMALSIGHLSQQHRLIISGAFDISQRSLKQVLRPRPAVVVLDAASTPHEGVERLLESGYSRAPVAPNAELDEVIGVVHVRDLIDTEAPTIAEVAHTPLVLPETVGALDALRRMRQGREHLAIVVNEHGSSEGIVTIEDLLEELVGEIYDESDRDVLTVERLPSGGFDVPGSFPIHDLEDVGLDLPAGDYTTVAGLVLDQLGRIPETAGDSVVVGGWQLTVLEVEDRAIRRVRVTPVG